MPLALVARIDERKLSQKVLEGGGVDASHMLARVWAKVKLAELKKQSMGVK